MLEPLPRTLPRPSLAKWVCIRASVQIPPPGPYLPRGRDFGAPGEGLKHCMAIYLRLLCFCASVHPCIRADGYMYLFSHTPLSNCPKTRSGAVFSGTVRRARARSSSPGESGGVPQPERVPPAPPTRSPTGNPRRTQGEGRVRCRNSSGRCPPASAPSAVRC